MPELTRTPTGRLALVVHRFRDMPDTAPVAAVAVGDGAATLTYGDLRTLVADLCAGWDRLGRIATWHSRETAGGGMVGDFCIECGTVWPCDTRRMADGSHEDLTEESA